MDDLAEILSTCKERDAVRVTIDANRLTLH
jgi:hypothetical protein